MSSIVSISDNNILFITTLKLKFLTRLFHLISVSEHTFDTILNLISIADTSFSQMKLTRNRRIIIYKKKYAEMFEN